MANGGIIGPVQDPNIQAEQITAVTASGCLTLQSGTRFVSVLVVAGGGGGSGGTGTGGGGGAGGLLTSENLSACGTIPIVVGAGGSSSNNSGVSAPKGNQSKFNTGAPTQVVTCGGGGGGGYAPGGGTPSANLNGGSGGGTGGDQAYTAGTGVCGQGNAGAPSRTPSNANLWASGGGGASQAGQQGRGGNPSNPAYGGPGGAGSPVTSIFGSAPQPFYSANSPNTGATVCGQFAGGGAGGSYPGAPSYGTTSSAGGIGGGGNGGNGGGNPGIAGVNNTGGGGGGTGDAPGCDVAKPGGNGGSGVVIIKEPEVKTAPGVWSMNSVYEYVKDGNWTN